MSDDETQPVSRARRCRAAAARAAPGAVRPGVRRRAGAAFKTRWPAARRAGAWRSRWSPVPPASHSATLPPTTAATDPAAHAGGAGRPRGQLRRRRPPAGRRRSGPAADAVSRARLAGMDAAGWDERYAASELVWSAEPNRFVAEVCADLAPGRALDLAAGEGRNAIWLAQRGWDVTATDFSAVGLDKGRRLAQQLDRARRRRRAHRVGRRGRHDDRLGRRPRPGRGGLPPAGRVRATRGRPARVRGPPVRRPVRLGRPRQQQPDRRHRRPPGPVGPDDRRRASTAFAGLGESLPVLEDDEDGPRSVVE